MKYTQTEILNALKTIRNECGEYGFTECNKCPFFNEYSENCMFGDFEPHGWLLADEESTIWRAFV